MSINSEIFNICKEIKNIEIRKPTRELVIKLNRDEFGYIARQQMVQFLGYIIVDMKREKIDKGPLPVKIDSLSDNERDLLKKAHCLLVYLNEQCIYPVKEYIPNASYALDPFSQFSYPRDTFNIDKIIKRNILNSLISAFHSNKLINNIKKISNDILKKIPSEKYLGVTLALIKRIEKQGICGAPEDFTEMMFKIMPGSKLDNFSKHIFSIMGLRKILNNINQLIYQAFLYEDLTELNEDNLIKIGQLNSNQIGEGLTAKIVPLGQELFSTLGDILFVRSDKYKLKKYCLIEGISTNMDSEFGWTQEYKLRVMDEDLNPFFGLVK